MPHHHRSGSLRQSNKSHKRSSSSKRSLDRKFSGRTPLKSRPGQKSQLKGKAARLLFAKQRRENQKQALWEKTRCRDGINGNPTPLIMGVIGLSNDKDELESLTIQELTSRGEKRDDGVCLFDKWKLSLRVYTHSTANLGSSSPVVSAMQLCRICNCIAFVVKAPPDSETRSDYISPLGEDILTAVKAQGLPSVHVFSLSQSSTKRKFAQRMMSAEFGPSVKFHEPTKTTTTLPEISWDAALRTLSSSPQTPPKYLTQLPRSYLIGERGHTYRNGRLTFKGYVRNAPLRKSAMLHVVNIGTFPVRKIELEDGTVLENDEEGQEDGVVLANPDALEGEQNLIGFDRVEEEEDDSQLEEEPQQQSSSKTKDYQSAWMDELDPDDAHSDSRALSDAFNKKGSTTASDVPMENDEEDDVDEDRLKALREERQFPDEVELRRDEFGRDRYARYRSLKNFRTSYWDPKENLPEDYAKLFQFRNFKGTQRDAVEELECVTKLLRDTTTQRDSNRMEEEDDDEEELKEYVSIGTLVEITLYVPPNLMPQNTDNLLLSAVSLLPHENKASVLHFSLAAVSNDKQPPIIKSKDVLTFHLGYRTFQSRPIFSHHNLNCDKHKFEKYMPSQGFFTASAYGPVTYTPCPVLVFQGDTLVAYGSVMNADADKIVLKRVILTGYPTKVQKRWATVKYMFYDPEDVKWFQPAGLTTKLGLRGHITESVGEHGTMKCLFNKPIQQCDTVCLPLYKRVYPKFAPVDDAAEVKKDLVVW